MYNLYENIYALCNERKITPGALCGELGFRRSVLSDLKNGRKKSLDTTTLMKIAEYFNVSVDYLLTGEEIKKAPTPEGEREITMDDFTYAFYKESKDLPDEKKKMLLDMARFMKSDIEKGKG